MTIEDLSARLERVERQSQRTRAAGVAALIVSVAIAAMGQTAAPPKVVKAERFEQVDGDGKMRAVISSHVGTSSGLTLYDKEGKARIFLSIDEGGGSGLSLYDKDGSPRVYLIHGADGSPMLALRDSRMDRAVLGVVPVTTENPKGIEVREPSSLVLFDKDGKVIERLPTK